MLAIPIDSISGINMSLRNMFLLIVTALKAGGAVKSAALNTARTLVLISFLLRISA